MNNNVLILNNVLTLNTHHNILLCDEALKQFESYKQNGGTVEKLRFPNTVMQDVVTALAVRYPTWRFMVPHGRVDYATFTAQSIRVLQDGEIVGGIGHGYFRGNYGVEISGWKLDRKIKTSNAARALSVIRKNFVKRDMSQRLRTAEGEASSAVSNARYTFSNQLTGFTHHVRDYAFQFALNRMREEFEKSLTGSQLSVLKQYDEAATHMATIQSVQDAYNKQKTLLIILDGDRFIVKQGDNVALYTPDELPEHMRGKVGMLKLCEDSQMISGVGCRVSAEVFVVLDEEQSNGNA